MRSSQRNGGLASHSQPRYSNHPRNNPMQNEQMRNQPSYPLQGALMIPGQRNQHYMTAPSIAISQRPLRPGRTMYSSSPQRPMMMQEYAMPHQYQVLQEPYGQIMRPGFIQNIPQPYPLPVSNASFPQQYISQTQPPFYAGMPPMYYSHVQSNQPIQPQQPQQQPAPNAGISTNTNKARSKRPSKIIIKDPNSNKDITEEIRTHSGTANGRSTATPPLANTAAQTESSAIQAEFAAKVEARRAGGKLDGEKSEGTNKEKPSQGEKSRIDLKIIENGKTPRDQEVKDSPMQIEKNSANNAKLKNANVVDNSKKEDEIDFEAQQSSSNMKEKTKKETSYATEVKVLKADREQNGNIESDVEISYRSKEPDDVEKKILTKSDHLDFVTQKNGTELKSDLDSKQMTENNKESPNNSVETSDNIVAASDNIVAASDNIVAASDNIVAASDHNPETHAKVTFDKNQTPDPSAVTHDKNLIPPDDSEATPDIKPDRADNSVVTPENSTATPDNKEATFDSKTAVPDCKSANPNDSSPITSKSPANPDNNTENVDKDKDITKNSLATFDKDMPRFDDRKLTLSNDQGTPCKSMITPDKSSTSSDTETLGNLENTPYSTESPVCAAADKEPSAMNCDKSNDTIVRDMEKTSKQKDDLPKPTAVVKEIRSNADGKKSEMKSETDSKTKTKSEPAKEDKVERREETMLKSDNQQAEKTPALKKSHSQADKPNQKQNNQRSQGKQSQPQATKPAEQPKKKSSKQRYKDINKKDTGGDLMDAYTEKKPSPEPVIEKPVEVVPVESEKPSDEDLTWEDKGETIGEEIKVEIETEPVPPEQQTKRKYERDFLVQFQYMQVCMEKPANLPNIDVILDVPQPPQSRTGSSGGGSQRSDFLPSYARPKNQPGGGKRDSRSKPPRKIIPMAPPPVVVLNKSENRWLRPEEKEKELSEEEKTTAELYRNVVAILNKLTPQKFKTLVEKIMALNIDSCERLEGVIDRIFEKAIGEPVFSVAYANMCRCLFTLKINDADGNVVSFRKLLLNRCQKEFEKEKEDEALLEKQKLEQLEGLSEEEQKAKKEELDEGLAKNKRRMLGNIKFIGELFKLKLLTENIMHDCIFKLLRAGDEESLESMCKLLFTIGKDLDSEKAKPRIVQYFDKINKIIIAKKVSSRVIFMLRDVVDLRDNKWIPRREEHVNPKTIDQIHKEAEMEKQQEQKLVSQLPAKDKQQLKKGSSGGRDSPKPVANDGWITTGKGGKSQPIDQNKLRNMAKRANNEQISLGPSSRFGQWGRGSSAGLNNSSQEQEQPQGNRYSALQSSSGDPSSGRVLYDPRRSNSTGARTSSAGPRGSDKSRQKSGRESAIEAARALSNTSSEKSHYTPSQPSASQEKQPEVKENENKNEMVNESLSEEELAKKTIALIDEYANIKDIKEAVACFTDLNSPSLHYFFVSTSVEYTYEKSMKVRGDTGRLLAELLSLNKLSKEQLLKGFNNIFEAADENSMDYPKLWNYLAEIINPLLGDRLKLNDLKPLILQHLAPIGKAAVLFAEILLEFKKSTCESEVVKLWNELEIDWSNILPPRLTIDEFLSRKNLNFLSSEANDELLKLLCASQLRNDIVFAHIEKNFKEEKRKEAEFINYLVSSVAESCLIKKEKETGPDCCEEKLKARRDILKKYLDNNMKLQLEALFTLQKIYAKYDKPKDMLSRFFNTLYDEEVITEGAFLNWKQDEDHSRQEAKGLALQATSSFFEWLQSAAVEGGEN
ncbi:eukaryotic translation initiation factor 4 gamma 3-like isoform X2 [Xenia sp. Carnegie-2017]|uniref:eukaryotic translation initiation factor 4 gamma 3-like isoform X2 n=1 Tax=Xenia sp. Carnegie-2017 TaxID=2897299 RepID=UPI001F0431B4|nr:eukaryotic translation initiation factor 4 gamma 3-like isoform X2 [Xenia sp. Carnegie-2017]